MTQKDKMLTDVVMSFNPMAIRIVGGMTGHPVDPSLDDIEIIHRAAEMVVFYIPDAPPQIREHAVNILGMLGRNWV